MRTVIAGSRGIRIYSVVERAIKNAEASGIVPSLVLCGEAKGVDLVGLTWAKRHDIPVERYPAQWQIHGKSAGYKRNADMARNADALIAVWDGNSRGTDHMINLAFEHGLKMFIAIEEII